VPTFLATSAESGPADAGSRARLDGLRVRKRSRDLPDEDRQRLNAAEQLLRAGEIESAAKQVDLISSRNWLRQPVLEVLFHISAAKQQWDRCDELVSLMLNLSPDESTAKVLASRLSQELMACRRKNTVARGKAEAN